MKDKIYKYGFLSVCGVVAILILYFAGYGANDRAHTFAKHLNGGMPTDIARCSMFASEHLIEVE